jgi:diacylglycerol O-acyltransferase
MSSTHYERLSFLDATFLAMEGPNNPMHVGGTLVFDHGGLGDDAGSVDIDAIRTFIGARLQHIPRYRQRLEWIPVERHPVWVDDAHFDLSYHVRHTALPSPGTEEQLREFAGQVLSRHLERSKPLWEVWVVEGIEGDKFALVSKVHHCMVDGIGGVDLLKVLLTPYPSEEIGEIEPFEPRPAPGRGQLLADEAVRRVATPFVTARNLRRFVESTKELGAELQHRLSAMTASMRSGWLTRASETPLNRKIGPNRRIDFLVTELDQVKDVKNAVGGTVNDVVIAAVSGAVRAFLQEDRGIDLDGIDFRAMVPVSTRDVGFPDGNNHVTMWLIDLPLTESDPLERLRKVTEATEHLKVTDQALGASLLTQSASFTPGTVLSVAARVAAATVRPFNMTITNVPGPQVPLYLQTAKLRRIFPMVPLWVNHGIGVALFSYDGRLNWGLSSDWDSVPDLDRFVGRVREALAELHEAATGS